MTKLYTVFDTDFDLSDIDDCHALIDTLEEIGKIRTWQLYDLIATTEQVQGNADDYQQFLKDIAETFGQVINVERELCTDDAAAKTILSQYSRSIDQYFLTNGAQPFIVPVDATRFVCDEIEQFTLEGFGTADPDHHVPVQQVEILQLDPHFVTKVLQPVRDPKTGFTRIGNIGSFSVVVFTVNTLNNVEIRFGLQHPNQDTDITDEIYNIAESMFNDYLSVQRAA